MHSSNVNDTGKIVVPKKWVSKWFSISLTDALQITLSWFLCNLLIIQWSLVLMLKTVLVPFQSGKGYVSQDLVMSYPR